MKTFALLYDFVPGFADRRAPFREAHLRLLHDAQARGLLVTSGPLGDPPDGALLVCRAESASAVEDLARADPYVIEGLVSAWRVRPWTIVIGREPTEGTKATV